MEKWRPINITFVIWVFSGNYELKSTKLIFSFCNKDNTNTPLSTGDGVYCGNNGSRSSHTNEMVFDVHFLVLFFENVIHFWSMYMSLVIKEKYYFLWWATSIINLFFLFIVPAIFYLFSTSKIWSVSVFSRKTHDTCPKFSIVKKRQSSVTIFTI